jgi:hypothetical protein
VKVGTQIYPSPRDNLVSFDALHSLSFVIEQFACPVTGASLASTHEIPS